MTSRPPRRSAVPAALLTAAALALGACEDRADSYEDAGQRLDAAIRRVERLKAELRDAEEELRIARAAIERKVDSAPDDAAAIPAPPE